MDDQHAAATLHVGTYEKSGGGGFYPVSLSADGTLHCGEPYPGAANASFAAQGRGGRYFIVDEAAGALGTFRRDEGGWQAEGKVPTGGEQPCYAATDGRWLAAANYGSGSVAVWRLEGDGTPDGTRRLFESAGSGPVKDRQEGPHCHCAVFGPDGHLYVTDLGSDAVLRLEPDGGAQFGTAWRAPPGSGPRHLLFHPGGELAVLVSELGSLLTTFAVASGELRMIESRSTLPAGFAGESLGGHLTLNADGSRAYVTNRGHDSIAVFSLDEAGRIEPLQHVASGGSSPRHALLLEDLELLVVAHEKDGVVATFRLGEDDLLEATGHSLAIPGACFILRTPC